MMKYVIWLLVIALLILHQDYWQWDDSSLILGILPFTLAYHVGISVAAAAVWALSVKLCWPDELDE